MYKIIVGKTISKRMNREQAERVFQIKAMRYNHVIMVNAETGETVMDSRSN